MSQRQKKLALGLLASCLLALVAFSAASAWFFGGSSSGTVHADEPPGPTPTPAQYYAPPPPPPFDAEAAMAAYQAADTFSGKVQALRNAGVKPWNPPGANPPPTAPSTPELSPEDEAAIEAATENLPPLQARIVTGHLRHQLANEN